jgi:hypothetical protein
MGKWKVLTDLYDSRPRFFSQFVLNPCAFRDFLMEHFEQAYSSLFLYQVQPVELRLTCCLVHTTVAINGKRNESTIFALRAIVTQLRESLLCYTLYKAADTRCIEYTLRTHYDFVKFICLSALKSHWKQSAWTRIRKSAIALPTHLYDEKFHVKVYCWVPEASQGKYSPARCCGKKRTSVASLGRKFQIGFWLAIERRRLMPYW